MEALWIALAAILCVAAGLALGWTLRGRVAVPDATLQADLAASRAGTTALREQIEQQQVQLREAADNARIERDAQRERERREAAVLTALSPVQETLLQMQRSVSSLERDRQVQYGTLSEQLRRSQETDETLRDAAESLASALRSNTARGSWGESQLRRIVEATGLTHHVDFDLQVPIETSEGASGRPDMVIWLPGEKALAVDAKAPMDAFLRATSLNDADQALAMRAHAKAVRGHVDALAKRAYWTGLSASPEFTVCFLPSEAMLSAALDTDPTLLDYAFAQRIALASPVSLWAVLKTVAYTWTQQEVSDQAHELFRLGNQLYERLGTLAGHAADVRSSLERAVTSYNRFAASLESRVLVTARRFPGIDASKLDALPTPAEITTPARGLTAAEFNTAPEWHEVASSRAADDNALFNDEAPVTTQATSADVDALRARLADDY